METLATEGAGVGEAGEEGRLGLQGLLAWRAGSVLGVRRLQRVPAEQRASGGVGRQQSRIGQNLH